MHHCRFLNATFYLLFLKFTANVPWVINNLNEIEKMNSYYRHMNQCITILMLAFVGAGLRYGYLAIGLFCCLQNSRHIYSTHRTEPTCDPLRTHTCSDPLRTHTDKSLFVATRNLVNLVISPSYTKYGYTSMDDFRLQSKFQSFIKYLSK